MKSTCALGVVTCLSFQSYGQEEEIDTKQLPLDQVVVSGTKFEIPIEKSGKTIYKLDREDLEKNAGKSVADILNEVPGVQIDGSFGNPGTTLNYYVRGGRDKNTLVLIDGVPLNDPTAINAFYDLRYLSLEQIESIEVLKGGLSTLYGTGASAGVINIQLKKSASEKISGQFGVNTGSYNTLGTDFNLSGKSNKFSYLVSGNRLKSGGFSVASDELASSGFNDDEFERKSALVKLGYDFSENFTLGLISGFDDFSADYDNGAFTDGNNEQLSHQFRIGLNPEFRYSNGKVSFKSMINWNDQEFISDFPSHNQGRNVQLDLVHEHRINEYLKGLWGINRQQVAMRTVDVDEFGDNKFTITDPYASLIFENNTGLNIHAGLRLNTHSIYESKLVYNLNPSFLFEANDDLKIKVLASVATSYITPTLFQLFSAFGNQDLSAEESLNYEGGFSFYFSNLEINAVYFKREETNPIGFDSSIGNFGAYANVSDERNVDGFEFDLKWSINDLISFSGNYARAEADEESTFYRIPRDKFGFAFNVSPIERTDISLKFNYTSRRSVQDFRDWPATIVVLDSYSVTDFYIQHQLLDNKLKLNAAVNNLLDTDFVGVLGFGTRGRNYNVGVSYTF